MSLRRPLLGLLALLVVGAPGVAGAVCTAVTSICNANDLVQKCCGATTCTIDAALTINGPACTLDFGARKVTLTGSLSVGSNTVTIEARSLTLRGPVNALGAGAGGGGTVNIVLTGGENPALSMGNAGVIDLSGPGRGGGTLTIQADGPLAVAGQGFKANGIDANASGGLIQLTTSAGFISVSGVGDGNGVQAEGGATGDGGTIRIDAAGDLILGQDRTLSVTGGGISEGLIDLSAGGNASFQSASIVSADGLPGTGASGGSIDLVANAISVLGNISATGGISGGAGEGLGGDGGEIDLEARTGKIVLQRTTGGLIVDSAPGGDGGAISLRTDAATNVAAGTDGTVQVGAALSAQGIGPSDAFGGGGGIEIDALGEIQITRPINANGAGGGIGEVDLNALRDVTVSATVSSNDPGGGGDLSIGGHSILVHADIQFQGSPNTIGGIYGGTAALVADSDVSIFSPNTVSVTGSGSGEGGRIDVIANRNVLVEFGATLTADGGIQGGFGGQIAVTAGNGDQAGDLTVHGKVLARGTSTTAGSSIDLTACSIDLTVGTVDSRGDATSTNTLTARTGLSMNGSRLAASTANVVVLGGGLSQVGSNTVIPAPTLDQRSPCTAVGVPANCLMPCPNCGDGAIQFPETCDPGAAGDRCATGCSHCQVESCSSNFCLLPDCDPVGGCVGIPKPQGTSCDDADKCNGHESCIAGACLRGAPLKCNDDNPCTADSCLSDTGCSHVEQTGPGVAGCDDGNPCTGVETCTGGVCTPGTPPVCTAPMICNRASGECDIVPCTPPDVSPCIDGNPCTADNCVVDHCENPRLPDDASCADSDVCNGDETCQSGQCTAGTPLQCDDHKFCTTDSCDPVLGCVNAPSADHDCCEVGDACNDGEACTTDACVDHHCTNVPVSNCCQTPTDCDDGNPCNGVEACVADRCTPGTAVPDETPCDDDTVCNGREVCVAGACTAGTALTCTDDQDVCTEDFCDPVNGCQHRDIPDCCHDVSECDDHNACTTDACTPDTHLCTHVASDLSCVPCQVDTDCHPDGRCAGKACQPNKTCTTVDLPCNDHNSHTSDLCTLDPQLVPVCTFPCLDNLACDDGKACNGTERCQAGSCVPGTAPDCNDHDLCTDDSCDDSHGCINAPKLGFASVSCHLDGIDAVLAGAAAADLNAKTKKALAKLSGRARAKLQLAIAADQTGNAKKRLKMLKGTAAIGRAMQRGVAKGVRTHKISAAVGDRLQQLLTDGLDAVSGLLPPK